MIWNVGLRKGLGMGLGVEAGLGLGLGMGLGVVAGLQKGLGMSWRRTVGRMNGGLKVAKWGKREHRAVLPHRVGCM